MNKNSFKNASGVPQAACGSAALTYSHSACLPSAGGFISFGDWTPTETNLNGSPLEEVGVSPTEMKQGVCLDCYRQSLFLKQMTIADIMREIGSIPGVTGFSANTETLLADYPLITDDFNAMWKKLLAETGLTPVTLGSYTDRLQFRNHVMTIPETAEALRRDLIIAGKLGFSNLRIMHDLPLKCIEMVLPLAEELDICLLDELLPPATILPQPGRKGMECQDALDMISRTGTAHFRLCVNLGLFQREPNPTQILDILLETRPRAEAAEELQRIMASFHMLDFPSFEKWMELNEPAFVTNRELFQRMFGVRLYGGGAVPADLLLIAPYLGDVYAKYICMYSDPGSPARWQEPSIPYEECVHMLKRAGYKGYLSSQRMSFPTLSFGSDRTDGEISEEERKQVRQHQEMLSCLLS